MKLQTLSITKIVNGGYGFGRLETGQVALVRYALPGETIQITIEQEKKDYLYGKIHHIVTQHDARRIPPCKYYGHCGGCDLQHCDYSFQLAVKSEILRDLLSRQQEKAIKEAAHLVAEPIESGSEFAYRQRIRLQVRDQNTIGFRRYHSHEIIPIDSCLLAAETINSTLFELANNIQAQKLMELSSELELLQNPISNKTICLFHFPRKPRPADKNTAKAVCQTISSIECIYFMGTGFQITGPFGESAKNKLDQPLAVCYSMINGLDKPLYLSWEAGGFCQVNLEQNRLLIEKVLELSKVTKDDSVLDLFCGMGNFSIPLAHNAKEVFGIEGQGSAIRSAKKNGVLAGFNNMSFTKSPVDALCKKLILEKKQFDCIIIDPPRQGAPELTRDIAQLTEKKLIYISCDPASLCRDLKSLIHNGFTIRKIQPIDMFPQNHHVETIVLLEK